MTDKQPAPVGDCHLVGKAVVPEDFGQLEAEAKRLQELMVSASMECAGKQQEALAEAMEAYLKVSTPSVMLSLLRQNAELKAERDALAAAVKVPPEMREHEAAYQDCKGGLSTAFMEGFNQCRAEVLKINSEPAGIIKSNSDKN